MRYSITVVTSFNQNCSLIWCERTREAVVVDPGGESNKLIKEIDKLNIRINNIWLTHGHIDHVGGAMKLKKYYDVPIYGPHKNDQLLLDNIYFQCKLFKLEIPSTLMVKPDVWLEDGDVLSVGRSSFTLLHCPGHSPGHVVFWNKLEQFIIMGDVLFKNGIGRTDLPGGNLEILLKSIKNKLFTLGDDIYFIPGHGESSTIGRERLRRLLK